MPLIAAVLVFWRFRRPPRPLPPREWADAAFAKLERDAVGGRGTCHSRGSHRARVHRTAFRHPRAKLTTEELLAAAEQAAWPVEQADPLRRLLEECDRAKFAGDVPDEDECQRLLDRGREWVDLVCPDTRARSTARKRPADSRPVQRQRIRPDRRTVLEGPLRPGSPISFRHMIQRADVIEDSAPLARAIAPSSSNVVRLQIQFFESSKIFSGSRAQRQQRFVSRLLERSS